MELNHFLRNHHDLGGVGAAGHVVIGQALAMVEHVLDQGMMC